MPVPLSEEPPPPNVLPTVVKYLPTYNLKLQKAFVLQNSPFIPMQTDEASISQLKLTQFIKLQFI